MTIVTIDLADCAYKVWFRRYCPACGGTRALEALLQLDFARSLRCNPIVVLLVGMMVLSLLPRLSKRFDTVNYHLFRMYYGMATLTIWLAFFLIRNALLGHGIDMLGDIL